MLNSMNITRRSALAGTAALPVLALPAGAAAAPQPERPNPEIPDLVAAYRKAWGAWRRAYDRRYKIEVAAYHANPELTLNHPLTAGSIFGSFVELREVLEGAELPDVSGPHLRAAKHVAARRVEIREMLERDGWFGADRRAARAHDRREAARVAVMDAPVACPADLLAKLGMFQKPAEWQEEIADLEKNGTGMRDLEGSLLLVAYRDLRAMASPPAGTA